MRLIVITFVLFTITRTQLIVRTTLNSTQIVSKAEPPIKRKLKSSILLVYLAWHCDNDYIRRVVVNGIESYSDDVNLLQKYLQVSFWNVLTE
jgi:hypothetical protein